MTDGLDIWMEHCDIISHAQIDQKFFFNVASSLCYHYLQYFIGKAYLTWPKYNG